jgi:ribose transport system permease protein
MTGPDAPGPSQDDLFATTPGAAEPLAVDAEARERRKALLDRALDAGIGLSLIVLMIVFSALSPQFLTVHNILNILDASSIVGVVSVGMTVALIAGQFDLSVGSIVGFTSSVLALSLASWGIPIEAAIPIAILTGIGLGVLNGVLVVDMGINSIIATLGTLAAFRGVALVLTQGRPIVESSNFLTEVGVSRPLGLPVSVYVMTALYVFGYVLLTRTKLGIHIYAVGGNPLSAERAGIRTKDITRFVFLLTAICAAVGGILITAKSFSGEAVYGQDLELDVLTAVLLGGVGLRGGVGSIVKTLLGVGIVGVISNGLVLAQVQGFYVDVARGVALICAVLLEGWREKRGSR